MGYREWRERQIERVDAMTARADARVRRAEQREAEGKVERERARVERQQDALSDWGRARARALGEDHDDLLARAAALGISAPSPDRRRRSLGLAALGELVVRNGSGVEGGTIGAYEAWRDRIVVEESMVAKEARGESLSRRDRAVLKIARGASKS